MSGIPAETQVDYTVTYLEMATRPSYDWPSPPTGPAVSLLRATDPPVWYFRSLYDAVGRDYAWEDIPLLPDSEVASWLNPERMRLYSLLRHGWPAGFFLLEEDGETTDLAYFGLVPQAIGQGLGTYLLRTAILTAWQRGDMKRLSVNTCTLDHPRALSQYQKAGFRPIRQETHSRVLTRDKPALSN